MLRSSIKSGLEMKGNGYFEEMRSIIEDVMVNEPSFFQNNPIVHSFIWGYLSALHDNTISPPVILTKLLIIFKYEILNIITLDEKLQLIMRLCQDIEFDVELYLSNKLLQKTTSTVTTAQQDQNQQQQQESQAGYGIREIGISNRFFSLRDNKKKEVLISPERMASTVGKNMQSPQLNLNTSIPNDMIPDTPPLISNTIIALPCSTTQLDSHQAILQPRSTGLVIPLLGTPSKVNLPAMSNNLAMSNGPSMGNGPYIGNSLNAQGGRARGGGRLEGESGGRVGGVEGIEELDLDKLSYRTDRLHLGLRHEFNQLREENMVNGFDKLYVTSEKCFKERKKNRM